MVGDGPDRPEAHRLARELGLDRQVTFMGKQDHVERLFPRMHALLMPSEMESFGLGALEAMACGVPPVATRVGGLPELVTDGVDGFLEGVGDIAAQSRRVIELLTNEKLHRSMAAAARRTAVERFASATIIPQYEKYYEEVIARGGS
jgi:glycosyltransferase involved in cell wall biosynthesis